MRPLLLYREHSLDLDAPLPAHAAALVQDLELGIILGAMGGGDPHVEGIAKRVLLIGLQDTDAIRYRQQILADCVEHEAVVRELHAIAVDAITSEGKVWGAFLDDYPESVLARATVVLGLFLGQLRRLRQAADAHGAAFRSEGFRRLFATLAAELDDAYLAGLEEHLERLRFRGGIVTTVGLGAGNRGTGYVLRKPRDARPGWRQRMPILDRFGDVYQVPDDDDPMIRALADLKSRGIALAAAAVAGSTDQILGFFRALRSELAFYVACLNLRGRLTAKGLAVCVPEPVPPGSLRLSARGLYDTALALTIPGPVVANDIAADGASLVVVTGANRGGKSTFLRSIGQAQLMLQAGMFVAAGAFAADLRGSVFTHFKREEDPTLQSGKLDEELRRLSAIVGAVKPGGLILFNESFASTNEREGSEIGRQVIRALADAGVKVVLVTHLYDLAHGLHGEGLANGLFLRAERELDGRRTFRIIEAPPLPTSFAADVYRIVFGAAPGTSTPPTEAPGRTRTEEP